MSRHETGYRRLGIVGAGTLATTITRAATAWAASHGALTTNIELYRAEVVPVSRPGGRYRGRPTS
jgi:hypothetical protein